MSQERHQALLCVVAPPNEGGANLWIQPHDRPRDQCRIAYAARQESEAPMQGGLCDRCPSFSPARGGESVRDALHAHAQGLYRSDAQLVQGHALEAGRKSAELSPYT